MKSAPFTLIFFTALFNFSCQQNVESSPALVDERVAETPQPISTPEKYEEIDIIEQFSRMEAGNEPIPLEIGDYKISPVTVKKKFYKDSPEADIYDAILSKKGKTIAKFEGIYYPLGNFMSFGLYPFLNNSEKQLLILEESNRYDRAWIINLSPKFEILFDSADFDVLYGYLGAIDIDKDGVFELSAFGSTNLGFTFSWNNETWTKVIFKYDSKSRKYLPASHIFSEYIFENIDEEIQKFREAENRSFSDFLQIFMGYIYAGKEDAAWKFFDESFSTDKLTFGTDINKANTKEKIISALNKDPIYKFIKADLKNK